jgi:nucleoredoxin
MKSIGIIALVLSLGTAAFAQETAPTPHVAVIADTGSGDLASVIVADLTSNPNLVLIERSEMTKIGDELKLQQLAGDNAVDLGKLLNADGLLYVKKQQTGFQVRLTAVGLGYVVFDDLLTADTNTDLPHLAQLIAQRITDYAPKLKLKPDAAVPISVLNIRADVSSGDATSQEQKLSLLLESKLSAQSNYVVLERRHASLILFEKSLSEANPARVLEGAYVVDGSFDQSVTPGPNDLSVHLRLRSPSNQENPLELHGSTSDLRALADQMVGAIQKAIGKPVSTATWQPEKEARAYLLEGIWTWQHGDFNAALQALDSADMLGEKAPDLEAARIHVLCCKAVGSPDSTNIFPATPDDPHPEARVEAIRRAFDEEQRFATGGAQQPLQILTNRDMSGMLTRYRYAVSQAAASLLVMLDRTQSSDADDIRSLLRNYIHFDPLHGPLPEVSEDFHIAIENADDLAVSPDEEKACYQLAISSPTLGPWLAVKNQLRPDTFCPRFIPDPNKRETTFNQFFQDLEKDETARPTALLELAAWNKAETIDQNSDFQNFVDYIHDEREKLMAKDRLSLFLGLALDMEKEGKAPVANAKLVDTLHFLLQHSNGIDGHLSLAWQPELFPADEAPKFWSELLALGAMPSTVENSKFFFDQMRTRYVNRWGVPQDAATSAQALVVNRFWYPKDAVGGKYGLDKPLKMDATGVWVPVDIGGGGEPLKSMLYHVGIDSTQADPFTSAPAIESPINEQGLVVTADSLYVAGSPMYQWGIKSMVASYDLHTQQWAQHDVPLSRDISMAAGHLYLTLTGPDIQHQESGIARYDEQTGETTLLASSRRNPPQNQFDGRNWYNVRGVFTGPGNKPCVSMGFGETYVINETPGDWPRLIDSGGTDFIASDGTRTIIYGTRDYHNKSLGDVVFMINPSKDQPELLLGEPAQSLGTEMQGKPGPMPAPWPSPPVWPPPSEGAIKSFEYGFRNDDLFARVSDKATLKNEIVWFQRGRPEPVHIPLSFELNEEAAGVYQKIEDAEPGATKQFLENPRAGGKMFWGPSGIFFAVSKLGFYYLPYSDIDAYLKAHSNITIAEAQPALVTKPSQNALTTGLSVDGANTTAVKSDAGTIVKALPEIKPPAPIPPSGQAAPVDLDTSSNSVASDSFLGKFKGHLVVLKDGHLQTAAPGALNGVKYVTFLFAASWYKPSGEIMQHLLPFYYSLKSKHPEYEIIFIDERESADDMEHYMTSFKMPWLAVRSGDIGLTGFDFQKYNADESIPCLVLVDESGKILSNSRVNGKWVGVFPVMQDTEKILPVSSESP